MRLLTVVSLTLLGAIASADELIDIPTARKIVFEDVKFEYRAQPTSHGDAQSYLGIGVGRSFELDLRDIRDAGTAPVGTFDFSYNYLAALPGLSPGLSFGVLDAANLTSDGRRFYAVTTFRNTMDEISGNVYADITLGMQVGSMTSPFVGVSVPFSPSIYLIAEDSGFRLSAGLEYRISSRVIFRVIDRNNQTLQSLRAAARF